ICRQAVNACPGNPGATRWSRLFSSDFTFPETRMACTPWQVNVAKLKQFAVVGGVALSAGLGPRHIPWELRYIRYSRYGHLTGSLVVDFNLPWSAVPRCDRSRKSTSLF